MKMKESKKKMRRLMMCQSIVDATTSCMIPADYVNNHRSLIRSSRRLSSTDDDQKLVNAKYIRLADHQWRGYGVQPCRRSSSAVSSGNSLVKVDQNGNNQVFQVVVMRVSIHCQGCAGKVKKHLSKLEGVTSFSIDLETKRVTVMGHLSPVAVLESMSKVKKAEFWSR